jgi:uncharacterized membrane protein HdeD (DUF308 family)
MDTKKGNLNTPLIISWSTILIEAILLLITGVYLLVRPDLTGIVIVFVVGFFALIGGIVDAFSTAYNKTSYWVLRFTGDVILALTGLFILLFPSAGLKLSIILFYIIAMFGMLIGGSLNIYAGVRQAVTKSPWATESLFWGIVLFGSGLFLINRPLAGTIAFVYALAIWLILSGLTGIFLAARIRTISTETSKKNSNIKAA